jgi:hypothetical protein
MTSFSNPYNNVGAYPPQPFGSIVDKPTLIETAGLNPYNFLDVGQDTAAGGRTPGNDIITPSHCTILQSDGYNRQSGV